MILLFEISFTSSTLDKRLICRVSILHVLVYENRKSNWNVKVVYNWCLFFLFGDDAVQVENPLMNAHEVFILY